jgi:hypothetical protein
MGCIMVLLMLWLAAVLLWLALTEGARPWPGR